jgi:hypothetical protein
VLHLQLFEIGSPNRLRHTNPSTTGDESMNILGICRDSGAIYEGSSTSSGYRANPTPVLTPIRFAEGTDLAPINVYAFGLAEDIFREDDFDPVTKIRRGRVFTMRGLNQPTEWSVQDPFRQDLHIKNWAYGRAQTASLVTYNRDSLLSFSKKTLSHFPRVVLGWEPFVTFWKIVSIESSLSGTPILTLKAHNSLGELPELIEEKIPDEARAAIIASLEKVEASINRLSPVEVIDRCRDALSIIFGAISGNMGKDLSAAITAYVSSTADKKEDVRSNAGRIVARLHSRGKPNEQHAKGTRPPSEDDAQLAVRCLWLVLVEVNWAK